MRKCDLKIRFEFPEVGMRWTRKKRGFIRTAFKEKRIKL